MKFVETRSESFCTASNIMTTTIANLYYKSPKLIIVHCNDTTYYNTSVDIIRLGFGACAVYACPTQDLTHLWNQQIYLALCAVFHKMPRLAPNNPTSGSRRTCLFTRISLNTVSDRALIQFRLSISGGCFDVTSIHLSIFFHSSHSKALSPIQSI